MELSNISQQVGEWMDGSGPLSDIVFSSRIRLARNISGYLFFSHANEEQQSELLHYIRNQMSATSLKRDLWYIDMQQTTPLERQVLTERHLISKQLCEEKGPRAVALAHDESLSLMINEEDHIRVQALSSGLQLHETYDRINRIDELLEEQLEYAFSPTFGYLTACPTNVGTGIRVSVMLHLPALKMTGEIEKVFRFAKSMHLAIRGLYGEGSEPMGDFFQLSNQTTLGKSENQIIDELVHDAVEPIVKYERQARQKIISERKTVLEDKIFRAVGILSNARVISTEETLYLLSYIRMGIHLNLVKDISLAKINKIFLLTQPGHIQHIYHKNMDITERDHLRADFVRKNLN